MSYPHRGVGAEPCGLPTSITAIAYVRSMRFSASGPALLWRVLFLATTLAVTPLLLVAQVDRTHAVGIRFNPKYETARGADRLLENLDLSYRMPIGDRWSAEATAGYWRTSVVDLPRMLPGRMQSRRFQATVTLQRDWRMQNPQWTFYAGGGLGFLNYSSRNAGGTSDGESLGAKTNLTVQGVAGFRYALKRAPLELDLGIRPQYAGRGFGLTVRPSVGIRYHFGRK